MSRSISYEYERARRRQLYLDRIRVTTKEFYRRYSDQYRDMLSQGFDRYIPSEMSRLSSDLKSLEQLLSSDPEAAREVSRKIGSYIREMWSLGHSAERQFYSKEHEAAARQRAEELQAFEKELEEQRLAAKAAEAADLEHLSELNKVYYQLAGEIKDRIVANLAAPRLEELKKEIRGGKSTITIEELRKRAAEIITAAEKQAEEWKQNTIISQKKQVHAERIAEAKELLAAEKIKDQDKAKELLDKLDSLQAVQDEDFDKALSEIEDAVDDALISEEIRRETVKAIYQQLAAQEFIVDPPQQLEDEENNYVLITAHRPSGNRVMCKIDLHGELTYQFDQYEGSTCLKDVERFNVDLQSIYSIQLSDERVLWCNPDDENNEARSTSDPNRGGMNGDI